MKLQLPINSQKDTSCHALSNYYSVSSIISIEIFQTWIILLHAHPVYSFSSIKSSVKGKLHLQDIWTDIQTEGQGDSYKSPIFCLQGGIFNQAFEFIGPQHFNI